MSERKLVVMVKRARRNKIADVVTALTQKGMTVEQQLDAIGMITGHADGNVFTALEGVEGVQSLRDDGIMHAIDADDADANM